MRSGRVLGSLGLSPGETARALRIGVIVWRAMVGEGASWMCWDGMFM